MSSTPIQLKVTKVGMEAIFDAENRGLRLELDKMVYSTANFDSVLLDERTSIPNVVMESAIAVGGVSDDKKTLRFYTTITGPNEMGFGAVGVYTKEGVLFAVASVPTGYLFKIYGGVGFIASFGLSLSPTVSSLITITTDQQGAYALMLMLNHENDENPHPQYKLALEALQLSIDDLNQRVTDLENDLGDLAGKEFVLADQFDFRRCNRLSRQTFYPLFYSAMGRPNGAQVNYVVEEFSVRAEPNNIYRQFVLIRSARVDDWVHVVLPVYVSAGQVFNVQALAKEGSQMNDLSARLDDVYEEVYNGKRYTVVRIMFDVTSGTSPYVGMAWMHLMVEAYRDQPIALDPLDIDRGDAYPITDQFT